MKEHRLKDPSSFIVVVLRSLRHGSCVFCGEPVRSLEESAAHWRKALDESKNPYGYVPEKVRKKERR